MQTLGFFNHLLNGSHQARSKIDVSQTQFYPYRRRFNLQGICRNQKRETGRPSLPLLPPPPSGSGSWRTKMNTVRTRERERGLDPLRSITSLLAAGWKYMLLPASELKTRSPPVFQGSTRGGGGSGGMKCQADRPQIGFCRGTITSMSTHDSPLPHL